GQRKQERRQEKGRLLESIQEDIRPWLKLEVESRATVAGAVIPVDPGPMHRRPPAFRLSQPAQEGILCDNVPRFAGSDLSGLNSHRVIPSWQSIMRYSDENAENCRRTARQPVLGWVNAGQVGEWRASWNPDFTITVR